MKPTPEDPDRSASQVASDDLLRSRLILRLIVERPESSRLKPNYESRRRIVQFWDDARAVPADVQACLGSWSVLDDAGYVRQLFDDHSAEVYIEGNFEKRHVEAFRRCAHPAMRSDYFRLCFMMRDGGAYIDADDEYCGSDPTELLTTDCLRLQPLCYDITADTMADPFQASQRSDNDGLIFYVNNNPLISPPNHPVIAMALERATSALLAADDSNRDIQSLTGPGNLTACLVEHVIDEERLGRPRDFELVRNWESTALSKWPLSYRSTDRNWRNWVRGNAS